jgi:hypothetical protein
VKCAGQRSGPQCRPARAIVRGRRAVETGRRTTPRKNELWRKALVVSAGGFVVVAACCCWLVGTLATARQGIDAVSPGGVRALTANGVSSRIIGDVDSPARTVAERWNDLGPDGGVRALTTDGVSSQIIRNVDFPARIVAERWNDFEPESVGSIGTDGDWLKRSRASLLARFAALETGPPTPTYSRIEPVHPQIPREGATKTALIDFETAPFPYEGKVPSSNRAFLDAGPPGHRGHVGSHGRVLWASETFGDRRVLLHIPPGFDADRPGVMIVFFHGHGANLARDVRDRQQLPAQVSASGANAVLVAPQFAVNAADSSAGKFWEPGGFKRFVDEAAEQLARLRGDPQTAQAFRNMPIVIVAYSGGYGPTLSVLERGGVGSRLRGIVLLDALYGGLSNFANWVANNRSTFFVSSYTPHNRSRNVALEQMLSDKSVPYSFRLRPGHLAGSVTFLSAGDISHRDFVTRAWAESPVKDVLVRLDDYDPKIETATTVPASSPLAAALPRREW